MKLPHTQITMLGTTSAGKTCFLLGMYAIMSLGVNYFTFTIDEDTDKVLSDKWYGLIKNNRDRSWPRANVDIVERFSFNFCYSLKKFASFDWIDYRGAALNANSTDHDRQELKEFMLDSDCIICCVSGNAFLNDTRDQLVSQFEIAQNSAYGRMLNLLQDLPDEKRPAIAIVITKYDLLAQYDSQHISDLVKKLFEPLFAPDGNWQVMICPVSLGNQLAQSLDSGVINPVNMHLPVTYATFFALMHALQDLPEQMEEHERKRQTSLQKAREAEESRRISMEKRQKASDNEDYYEKASQRAQNEHTRLNSENFIMRWWNSEKIEKASRQSNSAQDRADRYREERRVSQNEIRSSEEAMKKAREEADLTDREIQELEKLQPLIERNLKLLVSDLMSKTSTYYNGQEVQLEFES